MCISRSEYVFLLTICILILKQQDIENVTTTMLDIYVWDNAVKKTYDYYLYDGSSIVAAVGGNLGLFLGFSCYSLGKDLIDRFI